MLVHMLIKALLFYLLFVMVRKIYRGYRIFKAIKKSAEGIQGGGNAEQYGNRRSQSDSGVFEAKFRHLDDEDR